MAVVPLVISAASAAAAGVAASNAANYQAQVAKTNAEISQQKQRFILQDQAQKEAAMAQRDKAKIGEMTSQLASSGLDLTTPGSSKDVLRGQEAVLRTNRAAYSRESAQNWYAEKAHQAGFEAQMRLDQMEAENAKTTGFLKAGGSLMSGYQDIQKAFGGFSV